MVRLSIIPGYSSTVVLILQYLGPVYWQKKIVRPIEFGNLACLFKAERSENVSIQWKTHFAESRYLLISEPDKYYIPSIKMYYGYPRTYYSLLSSMLINSKFNILIVLLYSWEPIDSTLCDKYSCTNHELNTSSTMTSFHNVISIGIMWSERCQFSFHNATINNPLIKIIIR